MTEYYKEPRYNVHFRISTMPNGFMVLDYDATPEMGNIYGDEKHGYQMVIRDVSRAEARRVCNVLNEKDDAIIRLEEENKELKQLIKKVMDERVVDYPLLCKIKEMVKE